MIALPHARQVLESAGLVSGLPVAEVQARLRTGLRLADTGQRILAFYLHEMEEGRLYQASGHASTAHYAEEVLGLEPRRARELVAVGRRLLELPLTDAAFCSRAIGWSKVLILAEAATPQHEEAWLEMAKKMSCRDLILEIKLARPGGPPRKTGDRKGLPEIRFPFAVKVGTVAFQRIELCKQKLSAESERPVTDAELLDTLTDLFLRTEEDGSIPGKVRVDSSLYRVVLRPDGDGLAADTEQGIIPLPDAESAAIRCDAEVIRAEGHAGRSNGNEPKQNEPENQASGGGERSPHRHDDELDPPTPGWLRRRVLARDGHRCRSCRSRRNLMAHHIRYRSECGKTDIHNLLTLCERCHGLVHAGLLQVIGVVAETATFLRPTMPAPDPALAMAAPARAEPAPAEPNRPFDPNEFRAAFEDIAGQEELVERLLPEASGSAKLGRPFPHVLLSGPPGTGKSTLARAIAKGCGRRIVETNGPLLQEVQEAVQLLADLKQGDVLFVDEVHAVPRPVLETFYEAMTTRPFTLVAATTNDGDLPEPFVSRFALQEVLDFYPREVLANLVTRHAQREGCELAPEAATRIAEVAQGIPRQALRLVDRALLDSAHRGAALVDAQAVETCLKRHGYDAAGLDRLQQRYVRFLRQSLRPISVSRLARMLGSTVAKLLRDVEPFLFRLGLVDVGPHGRFAAYRPRMAAQSVASAV